MNNKTSLREHFLAMRSGLSSIDQLQRSEHIAAHAASLPCMSHLNSIGGYYPIHSEVNILPLLKLLHAKDIKTALPYIYKKNQPLHFRRWQVGEPLGKGILPGVQEPLESATEITPEALLVPLVAFDSRGHRLGYGGGYYDRTIHALKQDNPQLITIGIAYSNQHCDQLPDDKHDQTLDHLVTEEGVMSF